MEVSLIQSNQLGRTFTVADFKKKEKWWYKCLMYLLPGREQMNHYIAQIFIGLFLYAIFYGMLGKNALPGSEVFALFVIIIFAILGGKLIGYMKLPPLVGMLLVGFCFRNIHSIPYYKHISHETINILREMALSLILLRAGIGIDGESLKRLKGVVFRLTVFPCLTEVISMGVIGHFLLDLPYIFSFMLGFIISAISPEVVIPPVLELEKRRYGASKGIPALIIGAVSLDDILAIAGFTICFSIAFSTRDLMWTLIKAPLEPLVGFLFAVVFGVSFWYFPTENTSKGILIYYNVVMVYFGALAAMFLSERLHIQGSGPLTCIVLAFVAAIKWRKYPEQFRGIYETTSMMWFIAEPVLFSLIGAEITIETLYNNAGFAVLALASSLLVRSIMAFTIAYGANLTVLEKLFICCSYSAKASVQAAIGSQALDYARMHTTSEELLQYGLTVLNVCVLSLMLTAPLASILINLLGPVLLTKDSGSELFPEAQESAKPEEPIAQYRGRRLKSDFSGSVSLSQDLIPDSKVSKKGGSL